MYYSSSLADRARECLRNAAAETPTSTPVPTTAPDKKGGMQR